MINYNARMYVHFNYHSNHGEFMVFIDEIQDGICNEKIKKEVNKYCKDKIFMAYKCDPNGCKEYPAILFSDVSDFLKKQYTKKMKEKEKRIKALTHIFNTQNLVNELPIEVVTTY